MSVADLSFSIAEYESRLENVRGIMRDRHMNVLILDEIEAMTWVSGYGVSETLWRCCVVPLESAPFLIVRSLDVFPARERTWVADIIAFTDWEDPLRHLVGQLDRRGLAHSRIGMEFLSQSMPHGRFEQLRSVLPQATFVDTGSALRELRLRKSPAEIGYVRQAASIADAAMRNAVRTVRVGGDQRDVAKASAVTYLDLGADDALVGPLTSGTGWGFLHGHMRPGPLAPGAVVHIELTPRVRHYSARLMRSVVVGATTDEQREAARFLVDVQDRQIDALRPGIVACDVDRIVREPMLARGYRASYDNITGYTLGAYPHPTQRVSDFTRIFTPEASWTIEPGMVFHMYVSARGLAFSETVVVGEDGPERLTQTPRLLFEAGDGR